MPVALPDHDRAVATALDLLGPIAAASVPLGPLTTYRVGGACDVFVTARSDRDLHVVAEARRRTGLPVLIVGRGSNMLVADRGFRGIAVSAIEMTDSISIDAEASRVTAGGGVLLPVLARRTVAASLTGFEWAVGVPGSVGGAVKMNAGGHGSDMAATLVDVDLIDLDAPVDDLVQRTVPAGELGLRFRGSDLAAEQLVRSARLQLAAGDREASEKELSEIVAWRRENQPGGQNAGSVFVNPVPGEVSAGQLIDDLGLRGLRHGTAEVSLKHANFIQADEGGSADDVRELIQIVRGRVDAETGFALRSEIRLIGFEERR
jgi:UDP-N-acetylmuramate dehydrogenase